MGRPRTVPPRRRPSGQAADKALSVLLAVPTGISSAVIARWAHQARRRLSAPAGQLSIAVVGPGTMKTLNHHWRRRPQSTNVLSFPFTDRHGPTSQSVWGEIFLCPAVIRRQARQTNVPYRSHFRFLLHHGMIHLLGLDHHTPTEQRRWLDYERRLAA